MKILFIGSRKYDYLQDLTYSGLMKILGSRQLSSYRWIARNYIPYKKYPKNIQSSAKGIIGNLLRNSGSADAVVVASAKPDCLKDYINIAPEIPSGIPVIFIDGGDREEIGGDLERLGHPGLYNKAMSARPFDIIFKREYLKQNSYPANVFPFPLSFNFSRLPSYRAVKKYQVSFWAVEGHPIRTRVLEMLDGHFDCRENGTTLNQEFRKYSRKGSFYLKELAASQIALSFRGGGWDTLRYWEIPAVGSLMISQPMEIVIPDDFVHEKHAVFCHPEADDLIELSSYYLKHEDKSEKIALEGYNHARSFHSDQVRAKYLLDKISGSMQ